MENDMYLELSGFCPVCNKQSVFRAKKGSWYRGTLLCQVCENGSVPRERTLTYVLKREYPNWEDLKIHECSPGNRGLSTLLKNKAKYYTPTHYFSDKTLGSIVDGWRNENIECSTFEDEEFDLVIAQDVLEHIMNPKECFLDVYRTLKKGGAFIQTFPIRKYQIEAQKPRVKLDSDGGIIHCVEPEYHGNPVSEQGALVTYDYGYDIHQAISYWTNFDVEICRFSSKKMGILGEYTEVILCKKS